MRRRTSLHATRLVTATNQIDRGARPVESRIIDYWCGAGHRTSAAFAADVEAPVEWTCRSCGAPSALEPGSAPAPPPPRYFPRTSYEFLMMRRSVEDGEQILAEALAKMRKRQLPQR